jgi:signal transduction histidine kinase
LTSIKAYAQILRFWFRKAEDVKSIELVEKMDTQLDKLNNLITDLLDVTKIESGKLEFKKSLFQINEVVKEITEDIERTSNHTFVLELANDSLVYGNRDRIGQVVVNFISNAIKYSPEDKKIIVKTERIEDQLVFSTQDFGIGISKEEHPKVFERFYRGEGEYLDTYPGLGLGLFISSEIIKRHNGRIWLESEKHSGSTFYFSLPINNPDQIE